MPTWILHTFEVLQVVANIGALVGGGIIWKLYVDKLKATVDSKNAEIDSVKANRELWKDKAEDLEKRSPEFMERMLSERIQTREAEIARLAEDRGRHTEVLEQLQREKASLATDLSRTRGFRLMLALEASTVTEDAPSDPSGASTAPASEGGEIEVVLLGEVGVDSGQLMVTDPSYIDDEWIGGDHSGDEAWSAREDAPTLTLVQNEETNQVPQPFSYRGAVTATNSSGYGELRYRMGHPGAGVVFGTAWGDGVYPIYGELHDGRIVRAYINLG